MGAALPCSMYRHSIIYTSFMLTRSLEKQEILQLSNIRRQNLIDWWSKFLPICQKYSNEKDANLNDAVHDQAMEPFEVDDEEEEYDDFDDDQEESSHFFSGASQAAQNFNSQCMSLPPLFFSSPKSQLGLYANFLVE